MKRVELTIPDQLFILVSLYIEKCYWHLWGIAIGCFVTHWITGDFRFALAGSVSLFFTYHAFTVEIMNKYRWHLYQKINEELQKQLGHEYSPPASVK